MNTEDIQSYIQVGARDKNWYHDCEQTFVELFGRDRLALVCKLFAATSINTSLKSNITLFRKALYEMDNDLPVGNYLPNMKTNIIRVRDGGELSGRKISSFAAAMSGDTNAVVVDTWLARAFKVDRKYFRQKKGEEKGRGLMREGGVSDRNYTLIEDWVRKEATARGLEPRQLSSIIWAGIRIQRTGDSQTHYKEQLTFHFKNLFNCI